MTGISTQTGLNFIKNYDQNKDGLSKDELQNGKMNSCLGAMKSIISDDKQGFKSAMEALQFASVAEQNFDFISQASGTTPRGDNNSQTISPRDLIKTASNDGNKSDLTPKDIKSQKQQNEQQQVPMMQVIQKVLQAMKQMMGMGDQQTNNPSSSASPKHNDTGANNNNASAFATALTTPSSPDTNNNETGTNNNNAKAFATASATPSSSATNSNEAGTKNNGSTAFAMSFATGDSASAFASASTEADKNKLIL